MQNRDMRPRHWTAIRTHILDVNTRRGYGAEIGERTTDGECRTGILDQNAGKWTEIWERRTGAAAQESGIWSHERATSNKHRK